MRERLVFRGAIAAVWLATGLLVLHPGYRQIGGRYLDTLGLPGWLMQATCLAEIALGLRVLLGPASGWLTALQLALIAGFTVILGWLDPWLLVDPFGMLTKNLPLAALIGTAYLTEREGWTERADRLLRAGVAVIWFTEGLLPKILFQQPLELQVVAGSGLVPVAPGAFLIFMGSCQILSGVGLLLLEGRWLRGVLGCQMLGLLVLPLLVSLQLPELWVHPFGPLTKNLPILAGSWLLLRRSRERECCSR